MPFQPPTRPHSANPQMTVNAISIFPRPASRTSASRPHPNRGSSMSSFGKIARDVDDWDDPWDSSSDNEDSRDEPSTSFSAGGSRLSNSRGGTGSEAMKVSKTVPVPVRGEAEQRPSVDTSSIAASWASTSYHHVSHPSPSSPTRPTLIPAKTYSEGVAPPAPGTAVNGSPNRAVRNINGSGSKLPPGGAWEIVEPSELQEEETLEPVKVGKEAVREDVEEILRDPLQLLQSLCIDAPSTPSGTNPRASSTFPFLTPTSYEAPSPSTAQSSSSFLASPELEISKRSPSTPRTSTRKEGINRQRSVRTERRREKFTKVLRGREQDGGGVDLSELRKLAWSGIPHEVRPIVWQLLLNYLPLPVQPRLTTLTRKRKEYSQLVDQYFGRGLAALDQQIWHQIEIDVPRTRPGTGLWGCERTQRSLERILYVWAIRHPASGYVQGINDLVTPFFEVFLSAYIDTDPEVFDVAYLETHVLSAIEADSFWCLTKLLDGIQDNYISQQPGIQRLVRRMSELVKRIDAPLAAHFEDQGVEFMQFAFRWMNCLLMREISVKCTIRMWDTYLAEGTDAFSQFHLYVCSALLVKFSERLREMDFQEMIMFLQCLPTQSWTDHDVELLLSEAYVLKTVWQGAENHFANMPNGQQGQFGMLGR
ncbi:hypothetical protein IAR55_006282 [Kwoniella newhampshirensis]|uniref:Rab-GAP TBC domain-containing protein n=1 Tax=Kwoniella newhampshirensis TaxID=1651941 RepID=A0AAW0YFJ3_9TREE